MTRRFPRLSPRFFRSRGPFRVAAVVGFALAAVSFGACTRERAPSSGASGSPTDTGRSALVASVGQCALSQYGSLEEKLRDLKTSVAAFATAAGGETERAAARSSFVTAMLEWQKTEAFVFGPLATKDPAVDTGGQDLRAGFYAWPLDARCAVEQVIATKAYEATDFGTTSNMAARGLSALEYLLFFEGDTNACAADDPINKNGLWPSAAEQKARKAAYAKVVADDLEARAVALLAAWEPTKGNFLGAFTSAGHGSKIYDADNRAVSAAASAGAQLTLWLKDDKLGEPAGIVKCTKPTCPEMLESKFAKISRDHIVANLQGLKMLFFGCAADGSSVGFDDVLVGLGNEEFANRFRSDLDTAIAKVRALPDASLEQSLQTSLDQVKAARTAVKAVDTDIKVELKGVLTLTLPGNVGSDND